MQISKGGVKLLDWLYALMFVDQRLLPRVEMGETGVDRSTPGTNGGIEHPTRRAVLVPAVALLLRVILWVREAVQRGPISLRWQIPKDGHVLLKLQVELPANVLHIHSHSFIVLYVRWSELTPIRALHYVALVRLPERHFRVVIEGLDNSDLIEVTLSRVDAEDIVTGSVFL